MNSCKMPRIPAEEVICENGLIKVLVGANNLFCGFKVANMISMPNEGYQAFYADEVSNEPKSETQDLYRRL